MIKLILLSALFAVLFVLRGFHRAVWLLWPICLLLVPDLIRTFLPGIGAFTTTSALMIVTLVGFVVVIDKHGFATSRMLASDWLMLFLAFSYIMTDSTTEGTAAPWSAVIRYTIHFAPYLLGRVYLTQLDDFPQCFKPMVAVLSIASVVVLIETITGINVIRTVFATVGIGSAGWSSRRWGLFRSRGTCDSPPTMGTLLILMLPWASTAYGWAKAGFGPRWYRWPFWLNIMAVVGTLSRGPLLAMGLFFYINYSWYRRLRVPLIAASLIGVLTLSLFQSSIADVAAALVGEATGEETTFKEINGKQYAYNGSRHRMLQWLFYRDAIATAGLFGHGRSYMFLVDHPSLQTFQSMDCHYLFLIVLKGYAGLILFLLVTLAGLYNMGKIAWHRDHPLTNMAVFSFGALLAVALNLYTVYLEDTVGFAYFFLIGLSANLRCLPVEPEPDEYEWGGQDDQEFISEWDHHHDPVG